MDTNTPEDIQRQQADLQAKILSLLGSSAVVPSSASSSSSPAAFKTGRTAGSYDAPPTHGGNTSSGTVSYPQQSYSNSSSGYHSGYGTASSEGGNSGYGVGGGGGYGAYNYR